MLDLNKECRLCGKRLRGFEARLIGLCQPCHRISFQIRRPRLPPIQHLTRTGWRGLPSARELERWRRWENEIIERLDRENSTQMNADLPDQSICDNPENLQPKGVPVGRPIIITRNPGDSLVAIKKTQEVRKIRNPDAEHSTQMNADCQDFNIINLNCVNQRKSASH